MDGICIIILIGVLIYIVVKVVRKNNRDEYYEKVTRYRNKYPNAFQEKFGYTPCYKSMDYGKLAELANVSESELEKIEMRISGERERERLAQEEKKRKEEANRLAEIERQRKIKEEAARKEQELKRHYDAIKKKYPNGVSIFEKIYSGSKIKEKVISSEDIVAKYEKYHMESSFYTSWEKDHKVFSQSSRNKNNEYFKNWGCYYYDAKQLGVDERGDSKVFTFRIWQHFCESFCRDTSLDYSVRTRMKINYENLNEFINNKRYFKSNIYDSITKFCESYEETPLVLFADSNHKEGYSSLNKFHFESLKESLYYLDIPCFNLDEIHIIEENRKSHIIIIELISSNDRLISNCEQILSFFKDNKPCITYISLLKEYSSEEMQSIIKEDENKQKAIEIEKRLAILEKEEEDRRKAAIEKEENERREKQTQITNRLRSKVSNLQTVPRSSIPYLYLLNYYPTTCDFQATETEWNDRYLIWNFKNTPGKTSSYQHDSALEELIPRLSKLLNDTFGLDIKNLTLVCIPASSYLKTQLRYEDFSERICKETGMLNAYTHIYVNGERGAKHEGEGTSGNISFSFDKDFFNGKNVLLFDDVVTMGDSMRTWKSKLESIGANVIASMSVGKTTHERPVYVPSVSDDDLPF